MRKNLAKVTALALSGVMAAGMMTGLAGTKTVNAATTSSSKSSSSASDASDPDATAKSNGIKLPKLKDGKLKLDVSIADFMQSSDKTDIQKEWQKRMEKYLGCKLDIKWSRTPQADYMDNEMVVLQSGKVPDVATVTKGAKVNEYGEDGTLLNLSKYKKYMKYYPEYMKTSCGGEDYAKNKDGSMYYFMDGFYNPQNIQGAQSFTSFAYRFDILKQNNWTPATTLDEFTDLCKKMQSKIDDGSLDLKYVMMNSTKDYALYRGFVGIFHTWDCVYYNGKKWVYGPIENNFRTMLKYLNGLYKKGYIDPEFATADANQGQTKATTNVAGICPTLWSGSASAWNTAKTDPKMEWGLSYLPKDDKYGTPWKWGSRLGGKSLNNATGIYISAKTKHPEYVTAMIDYQYSDQMVELMNWGIEGKTYTKDGDKKTYSDDIMKAEDPATESAKYGMEASSVCRAGIPFNPIDFDAMLDVAAKPEPWWNKDQGYYEGKYWVETDKNGGKDSVSPFDRPPITYLSASEESDKAQLAYGGVCDGRAKELALQFISGEKDINSDKDWKAYIKDVKSQTDGDFDDILKMLNKKTEK